MDDIKLKVGFIGAGAMATALVKGFIASGLVHIDDVKAYDVNELIRMIYDGTIKDSKTMAAILAYKEKYLK